MNYNDVEPTTLLDDTLARSKRLAKMLPFRLQLPPPTILHQSRKVLFTSRGADDTRIGYFLLAQQNINIEHTPEILGRISYPHIIQDNYMSFQDRSRLCYQDLVVNSINNVQETTEQMNSDFLRNALKFQKIQKAQRLEYSKAKYLTTVPIYNLKPELLKLYPGHIKMELIKISGFYCGLLSKFDENIARNISEAILANNDLYNKELQIYLSDTFDLISHIKSHSSVSYTDGALSFLESQKKRIIRDETNANLRVANRGGKIGFIDTIQGYLKYKKNEYVNSPWAILFYAIRCGERQAAFDYASSIGKLESDVVSALKCYANNIPLTGNLRGTLIEYLNSEFISPKCDKFKTLTLSVLTKFSKIPKHDKKLKIQDWIWLKLKLLDNNNSNSNDNNDSNNNNNNNISNELKGLNDPQLQGQLLLMGGLFEEAAKWFLSRTDDIKDNLHLAIALHVTGLLPKSDLILEYLINHSIEVFKADKKAAVQYLALISDENRIPAIAKLVVKADDGYMAYEDPSQDTAPIALVLGVEEQIAVLSVAIREARRLNLYDLSVKLCQLAGKYRSMIEIDVNRLKQIIEINGALNSANLNTVIQHFALIQERSSCIPIGANSSEKMEEVTIQHIEKMRTLIKLASACEFQRNGDFVDAVNGFEETNILPTSPAFAEASFEALGDMDDDVKEIVPEILVQALDAYCKLYRAATNKAVKESIKMKGLALKDFASHLDLHGETQAQILQMHLTMQ